jgi:hypothetical protein
MKYSSEKPYMSMAKSNNDKYGNPFKGDVMGNMSKPAMVSTTGPMQDAKKAETLKMNDKGYPAQAWNYKY